MFTWNALNTVPPGLAIVTRLRYNQDEFNHAGPTGTGVTVTVAVLVTPPDDAEIVTSVNAVTEVVLTVNVALAAPAVTVTSAGTPATTPLLLARLTVMPPAAA